MSGLIPQSFLDELLNRTDIIELIDHYVPLKKSGTSFVACCPFHNEKTPSFNVNGKKQFFHCFGCGLSGNSISFIMKFLNQGFIEAVETIAHRLGLSVPHEGTNVEKKEHDSILFDLLKKVSSYYQENLKMKGTMAVEYLKNRGLTGNIAKNFSLGFALPGWQNLESAFKQYKKELIKTGMLIENENKLYDRYRNRIMFPIHDRQGRIIGFGGRALDLEQKPKYLNSPETVLFQKSRELYGLYQALQKNAYQNNILLVEGYLDVLALAQYGIENVVAALGTSVNAFHIQLLSKYTKEVIFCFDGDEAGRQAAFKTLEICLPFLNGNFEASFVFLPEGQDPDSFIRQEGFDKFQQRLNGRKPFYRIFLDNLSTNINLKTLAGKSQLIQKAKPFLNKMPESAYKELLLDELMRLTHLEHYRLLNLLNNDSSKKEIAQKPIERTPTRLAIALIMQNPDIIKANLHSINFETLDGEGQELLQTLLIKLKNLSQVNTGMLLESFRESPFFDSLMKLASWNHQVPEKELFKEFSDIMNFLQKQNLEQKINQYLVKSRNEGLTYTEKQMLQEMLKKRHYTFDGKK